MFFCKKFKKCKGGVHRHFEKKTYCIFCFKTLKNVKIGPRVKNYAFNLLMIRRVNAECRVFIDKSLRFAEIRQK